MEYAERRPKNIIIFTGLSASGKSTVAERLSQEIGAPVISLRQEVLHPLAIENGYSRARFWILATCDNPLLLDLERNRLTQVIQDRAEESKSANVIIDDLIDPGARAFLSGYFPESKISVVLIKSNRHLRRRWITKRMGISTKESIQEQKWLDGVKVKAGIFRVIQSRDLVVKNMGKVEDAVACLREFLNGEDAVG